VNRIVGFFYTAAAGDVPAAALAAFVARL